MYIKERAKECLSAELSSKIGMYVAMCVYGVGTETSAALNLCHQFVV